MTNRAGCRSCTPTRKCVSCQRRNDNMPADGIKLVQTAVDVATQAAVVATSCDTSSSSSSDTGGSFCGDI